MLLASIVLLINSTFFCAGIQLELVSDLRWADYEKCLRERDHRGGHRDREHIAIRGSNIQLDYKECIEPTVADVIEDEWRTDTFGMFDGYSLGKFNEHRRREAEVGHYGIPAINISNIIGCRWEWLITKDNGQKEWLTLVPAEGKKPHKKVAIEIYGAKKTYSINSHWQLVIHKASISNRGWYRCYDPHTQRIASIHHVEIDYISTYPMGFEKKVETICTPGETIYRANVPNSDGKVVWKCTPWSGCNKCSEEGEQRRQIECFVQGKEFARYGGELPCMSALLPARYHDAVKPHRGTIQQVKPCREGCPSKPSTRWAKKRNGEWIERKSTSFLINSERAPLLPPAAEISYLLDKKGEDILFDCTNDNSLGVIWLRPDGKELTKKLFRDAQYVTAKGQLILKRLDSSDKGRWRCFGRGPEDISRRLITVFELDVDDGQPWF